MIRSWPDRDPTVASLAFQAGPLHEITCSLQNVQHPSQCASRWYFYFLCTLKIMNVLALESSPEFFGTPYTSQSLHNVRTTTKRLQNEKNSHTEIDKQAPVTSALILRQCHYARQIVLMMQTVFLLQRQWYNINKFNADILKSKTSDDYHLSLQYSPHAQWFAQFRRNIPLIGMVKL